MKKISHFLFKNEKWLTPTMLIGGFVIDNLTLRRSDLLAENILLGVYFCIIFIGLILWHKLGERNNFDKKEGYRSFIFLVIQFAFGGLFSSLTVFYINSASLFASWPFLLLLFGGMISTEYFKKHFTQFLVQIGTVYILLFTYLILLTPLIVRAINAWVFILSGILSLIFIFAYIILFKLHIPKLIREKEKYIITLISGIFLIINVFYFSNIIPPIPLILKETGIYKQVKREKTDYSFLSFEKDFSFKKLSYVYTIPQNSQVFFYSSVYAPINFKQKIVHEWQEKDSNNNWETISKVPFPIIGGSSIGYRGYTISNKIDGGEYRVVVKTERGQVLGIYKFFVK